MRPNSSYGALSAKPNAFHWFVKSRRSRVRPIIVQFPKRSPLVAV